MTTRLTISSLAAPITIKANATFSAPLAAIAAGPFVIALGTTTKGATINATTGNGSTATGVTGSTFRLTTGLNTHAFC